MALIECPECRHAVSEQAEACPNCGHPVRIAPAQNADAQQSAGGSQATIRALGGVSILGGILLAFGSLLPWRTATFPLGGTISIAGTEGDGVTTLVLGLVVGTTGLVIAMQDGSRIASVVGIVAAAASSIATFIAFGSAREAVDVVEAAGLSTASIGIGLWIVAIGAIAALTGTVGSFAKTPRESGAEGQG